jgi:hypothetical protein
MARPRAMKRAGKMISAAPPCASSFQKESVMRTAKAMRTRVARRQKKRNEPDWSRTRPVAQRRFLSQGAVRGGACEGLGAHGRRD